MAPYSRRQRRRRHVLRHDIRRAAPVSGLAKGKRCEEIGQKTGTEAPLLKASVTCAPLRRSRPPAMDLSQVRWVDRPQQGSFRR